MKEILYYSNRKSTPLVWDVSTKELKAKAVLSLFKHLDESWQIYTELSEDTIQDLEKKINNLKTVEDFLSPRDTTDSLSQLLAEAFSDIFDDKLKQLKFYQEQLKEVKYQKDLLSRARLGSAQAAYTLLQERNGNEYECWDIYPVQEEE